jgi:hypothetical protein
MDRPILFSGEMVRAILEGRKTQTRRVIKPQPGIGCKLVEFIKNQLEPWWISSDLGHATLFQYKCPYGVPGDRLWVRETWQAQTIDGLWWHEVPKDQRLLLNWAWTNPVNPAYDAIPPHWLPSIHMPKIASRITLEIVNVRVERLQDISEDDAYSEGIRHIPKFVNNINFASWSDDVCSYNYPTTKEAFHGLWDSINGKKYPWESNPWVWVVEFKVV